MIPDIHPLFRLNGHSLDRNGVMTVAYSYVKEGLPWEQEIGDFLLNWLDDYDVMTVYTSGSTGVPKSYKLDKQHMINSALMTGSYFDLGSGSQVLCCLPLSYIAGKMMMVRAMVLGWCIDLVQPSAKPLKKLRKRYDFTAMTPYQVHKSLKHIHKTKTVLIGGAPVSEQLVFDLDGKHTRAYHSYGMTETCSHIAIKQLYPHAESFFKLLGDVSISKDDRGCLVIHAPQLCAQDLITNDIVEIVDDQNFQVLGRLDDVINTGAVKVHPATIESKLSQNSKERFFITSEPDVELGNVVVLVVEGKDRDFKLDFDTLEPFERPKKIYYIDPFIETHTGKIDKRSTLEKLKR